MYPLHQVLRRPHREVPPRQVHRWNRSRHPHREVMRWFEIAAQAGSLEAILEVVVVLLKDLENNERYSQAIDLFAHVSEADVDEVAYLIDRLKK